jgi:hypothetical protein
MTRLDHQLFALTLVLCGLATPTRAQTDIIPSSAANTNASAEADQPFSIESGIFTTVDSGQVGQPAGPPPTPRHTGI